MRTSSRQAGRQHGRRQARRPQAGCGFSGRTVPLLTRQSKVTAVHSAAAVLHALAPRAALHAAGPGCLQALLRFQNNLLAAISAPDARQPSIGCMTALPRVLA